MANRAELVTLAAKIRQLGDSLTASEQKYLSDMIARATSDAMDDADLDHVAGGHPVAWVKGG